MEITTNRITDPHQVRITSGAGGGTIALDGVDLSRLVQGYTLHQVAGQPAQLILEFAPGRPVAEYDGLARVAVGVPYEPGEAADRFLAAIDAKLLEEAAMHRMDLAGGRFTAAVVEQLRQWARGDTGEGAEPSALLV
ncbi:hypothetical protein Snoj_32620 [Streptomyces nojiriensis]|uniref:Uncharacterized protein n=1 Tax=Streptomyces nojiriensis TaxID=66374 RepID=A0ABQ3SMI3_9ACTN|nr:hypothetical protein [Streptomyces nojiriensis]QTI42913.1 hypothetical protein JYK04_00674 [Streptomyces nojiriensis]GGS33284.1 hypothetical protein GCM10010205_74390 [Streptomyces nojiriensis]GHI69344.1 hypothetical protein Snoj_32620 [Streptomyces nojiriensis]